DRDAFMAHWTKIMANDSVLLKTILFNDQVAGNIVSWEQDGEREVGYWVGKEFWGKGVATEALREFLNEVKTRPLVAHVAKHNVASRRVLEKCGFTVTKEDTYFNAKGEEIKEVILNLI
ncbi:MAG TPA: GNAT family N-acetyltransferase, partial [Anaerolineales bacterium]|nr:GNAT family N-acetyltransferase [Anaerolineales bacterium]